MASRRRQPGRARPVRIGVSVDAAEHAVLVEAAGHAGVSVAGYVAEAALSVARGRPATAGVREALVAVLRAGTQVSRVGTNLNQAVAKLNATGQAAGDLPRYAEVAARAIDRLDAAAEQLRARLR